MSAFYVIVIERFFFDEVTHHPNKSIIHYRVKVSTPMKYIIHVYINNVFQIALFNFSRLDVVALVCRVSHGEGLSRQRSVGCDGPEQIGLVHCRQQQRQTARLFAQFDGHFIAMDVVDAAAFFSCAVKAGGLSRLSLLKSTINSGKSDTAI